MAKLKNNKPLVIAVVIALIVVVFGGWLLVKNGIFADTTATTPQFTSFSTGAANGTYEVTYAGLTNFEPSEMYIWFNCPTATATDTKAALYSKCGAPSETGSLTTNDVRAPGVRVKAFQRGGGFKVTFPTTPLPEEMTAVAYASSSAVPNGLVMTHKYTPRIQKLDPHPGTPNFSMSVGYTELGTRFRVEKLDQADGLMPNRKYTFWYDCPNAGEVSPNATVAELTQKCGTPNVSTSRPTDRYHIYRTNLTNGSKTFVAAIEEMTCSSSSMNSAGCSWPGTTIFAGKQSYTISDPTTTLNTYPAKGDNKMVFRVQSSRSIDEAYVWWDCNVQPQDDTKAELISRCGTPHERINLSSSQEQYQGDIASGARVQVSGAYADYQITLPPKVDAKAVAYVESSLFPNGHMVATKIYSTRINHSPTAYGNTNFSIGIDEVENGTRFTVERTNAADGSLPQTRYWYWYNCSRTGMPLDTKYTTMESSCGPGNTIARPGRFFQVNTSPPTSEARFFVIAQEKQCDRFTYRTDNTNCRYVSNAFVGDKAYAPSTYATYTFQPGFNAMGMSTANAATKFQAAGMRIYDFNSTANAWTCFPGDAACSGSSFTTVPFKGYYLYNSTANDISIKIDTDANAQQNYSLSRGWNMFWTNKNINHGELILNHDGVLKNSTDLVNSGIISDKIFIINNDKATTACQYFKLFGTNNNSANCPDLSSVNVIPTGKAFWVYVN